MLIARNKHIGVQNAVGTHLHLHVFTEGLARAGVEMIPKVAHEIGNDTTVPAPTAHHAEVFPPVVFVSIWLLVLPYQKRFKAEMLQGKSHDLLSIW